MLSVSFFLPYGTIFIFISSFESYTKSFLSDVLFETVSLLILGYVAHVQVWLCESY